MAHELVSDDSMVYVGERPWHGLGIKVEPGMSPQRFLEVAKLDWNVDVVPFPQMDDIVPPKNSCLLVRPPVYKGETKRIAMDIIGENWLPTQNTDAADLFAEYVKAGSMVMETAGALKNGEFVWFLAKTTDAFELEGGDEVRGYFMVVNSHKYGKSLVCKLTATRVVCMNTMSYALNSKALGKGEWRMSHQHTLTDKKISEMKKTLGLTRNIMGTYQEQAEFLANTKMPEKDTVRFLAEMFSPKLIDGTKFRVVVNGKDFRFDIPKTLEGVANIDTDLISGRNPFKRAAKAFNNQPGLDLRSSKGKAWGSLNGVTFFLDHVVASDEEQRMMNSTLGTSLNTKERAMSYLLDYAKAAA